MNNPTTYPAPQPAVNTPALPPAGNIPAVVPPNNPLDDSDNSSSFQISDTETTTSSESDEDDPKESDKSEADTLADEEYWEEDRAADAWLARHPGGTRLLYPQLFIVKPHGGKVVTPSRNPNRTCFLLHLPREVRDQIYKHYFERYEEVRRPKEEHVSFLNRDGKEIQKIRLSSEDVEVRFWLSTALLQTSRQVRFEATSILFETRVFTVDWLLVLPRFVEFLGKEGCAMVRYLDIWDTLNLQGDESRRYRDVLRSISHFSHLQHLRIVLSAGVLRSSVWSDRTRSWFDASEWSHRGDLKEDAIPKIRTEDIESHWPEYEVLKSLKAQKFTLAVESIWGDGYHEFDRNYGAYPEISKSMQSHPTPKELTPSLAPAFISSTLLEVLEAFGAIEIHPRGPVFTPSSESGDEDSNSPTWQDTDTLASKTIPLYNSLREFFHYNIYLRSPEGRLGETWMQDFAAFPTARKSTGSIMRDCAFCYLSERHCGHHALPDQPPFEPNHLGGDGVEESAKTMETRFENLSYVDMQNACRDVVQQIQVMNAPDLFKVFVVFAYLGRFETPINEYLAPLDAAVEVGWTGKRVDKDEVPPWDMMYREVCSRYHVKSRG
jgi:hypothetical protein